MVRPPVLGGHQIPLYSFPFKPRLPCCALSTRQFFLRQRVYHGSGWKTWHGPHRWQIISCKWTLIWLMSTGGYHESISLTQKVIQHTRKAFYSGVRLLISLSRCSMFIGSTSIAPQPPLDILIQGFPHVQLSVYQSRILRKNRVWNIPPQSQTALLSGQQWNSIAIGWKICNIWNMCIYIVYNYNYMYMS